MIDSLSEPDPRDDIEESVGQPPKTSNRPKSAPY